MIPRVHPITVLLTIGLFCFSTGTAFSQTAKSPAAAVSPATISFPSGDGLEITADLYIAHEDPKTPFIVLFHQAGWSRGEYREIAPRLNILGFNCMAVDQRSGGAVNDVENETHKRAEAAKKGTNYADAFPDLVASMRFVREHHAKGRVVAWGSSYSAALVLKLGGDHGMLIDGVLAFAPGEYFESLGKSKTWIQDSAKTIEKPVFITSAKNEHQNWKPIYDAIPSKKKVGFLPETDGNHGSRALWNQFPDNRSYWNAVVPFLREYFLESM